jgi:hypothetical protein
MRGHFSIRYGSDVPKSTLAIFSLFPPISAQHSPCGHRVSDYSS